MALGKRLEALIEDPPDWLDGQARARVDGARHSLGTRIDTLGGWLSLLGRVGGPANPDFVDWLAVDRYDGRSEEHTSELQSLMRISYAVFCLKKKNKTDVNTQKHTYKIKN